MSVRERATTGNGAFATGSARYIISFDQASKDDHPSLGGKCAGLAALIAAGAAVPPGFAVTTHAYADMLAAYDLADQISARTDALSAHDVGAQARIAQDIRDLIRTPPMPAEIAAAIRTGYAELCDRFGQDLPVAVRSSGTAEDLPKASFAGQGDTYLWTVGADAVIDRVRDCWASLFTARAIAYREKQNLAHLDQAMAVGVQTDGACPRGRRRHESLIHQTETARRSSSNPSGAWASLWFPVERRRIASSIDKVLLESVKRVDRAAICGNWSRDHRASSTDAARSRRSAAGTLRV